MCCGQEMEEIVPGTTDGKTEYHIPVWEQRGNKIYVTVGEEKHPMTADHYIQWIALKTKYGNQRKELLPESEPMACFALCEGDEVEAVYAYCNRHGLWKW